MSHPIVFPHRKPNGSLEPDTQLLANATVDQAIQRALERQYEKMIEAVNYLEALQAHLHRQLFAGSHLSLIAEPAPVKAAVEVA